MYGDGEVKKTFLNNMLAAIINQVVALICAFILYTVVLAIIYQVEIESSIGYFSTAILIVVISFSSLCEYLFGITN